MSAISSTRRDPITTSAVVGASVCFPNISLWRLKATQYAPREVTGGNGMSAPHKRRPS